MKLITHKEIADMVGMNPAHVRDRLTKRPNFPRAFLIGGARRWDEKQVDEWIKSLPAGAGWAAAQDKRGGHHAS